MPIQARSIAWLLLLLCLSLTGCSGVIGTAGQVGAGGEQAESAADGQDDEVAAIRQVVEDFGAQLQKVSLLAPEEVVRESIQEHYGDYVTPELLAEWQENPEHAPGRLTSSPWPDRIEITSIEPQTETSYAVQGLIVEITSVEKTQGGVAAKHPVTLTVIKIGDDWRIDEVLVEDGSEPGSVS